MIGALSPSQERELSMFVGIPAPELRETYSRQFTGIVSNINIYNFNEDLDIQRMSSDPCLHALQGDFLAWQDIDWVKHGEEHLKVIDVGHEEVCNEDPLITMSLPLEMNRIDANNTCHLLRDRLKTQKDYHSFNFAIFFRCFFPF